PVLQYLSAAGVGTIGIIDFDTIELSNLQRQILFTTEDIGKNKAKVAAKWLSGLNPNVDYIVYPERLTTKNALSLFNDFDIVVDGSDNFATRYLANDAAVITNTPLVYGAIYKFEGQVSVFNYQNGPTYRCLYPEPPGYGAMTNCSDIGVLGVLPGMIGTYQANETLKIILGIGEVLKGKLLLIKALNYESQKLSISKNQHEIDKVMAKADEFENRDYDVLCTTNMTVVSEINASELKQLLGNQNMTIIDVRESFEEPRHKELNAKNVPLGVINSVDLELPLDEQIVVYCQHGIRSKRAIEILKQKGYQNLVNLTGGIVTWN
ncbi:MAG: dinucleotide-utilizing protein, partial [Flavobacteriales bacterium]|nr:dinucleotide-utilizing protein [Flavobacteriales bacterium]